MPHPIVHIEFSANDCVTAAKFYSELFGWKTEQIPQMNYATFAAEGGPGGGFNPVDDSYPAGTVMVYIDSDDIDADLARVVEHGGKILTTKHEIPGTGWFGVFSDPTGNRVALFTSSSQRR